MVDVIVLGLNGYGEKIYNWLVNETDANVLCVVTNKCQYRTIEKLQPELLVSAGFEYIIPERILQIPELGAVNLHHSYLPYNRGYNPDVWSIIEEQPAGVSIHYMSPRVDSGDIIDRRKVEIKPDDTSKSLYERLEYNQVDLFKDNWRDIKNGTVETTQQVEREATFHYKSDFVDLWELDESETVKLGDFIDRLRALTHPPYNNAYLEIDGEKHFIEIEILPESKASDSESIHWNISDYNDNP